MVNCPYKKFTEPDIYVYSYRQIKKEIRMIKSAKQKGIKNHKLSQCNYKTGFWLSLTQDSKANSKKLKEKPLN